MAAGDKITEAVRILVALVGVAQDPTLLSALKAGPGIRDSLKKLASSPPPGFARLAEDLGRSAAAAFATLPEKPRDAEELYLQMMEAGLPDPTRIMAERMDAAAITEGMLAGVTEREQRTPEMQALFRRLTQPALERLLADKDFAADLTPAFMRAALENFAGLAEKLDGLSRQGRDVLEVLALRFDVPRIYDLSDAQLREALELRAADYRRFQEQIEAIDARSTGLSNLKAAARDAAERLDFEEVETLLSQVHGVETETAAETAVARADNALLRGRPEQAFTILSAAADSFGSIDALEPARRRLGYGSRLYAHGLRYGGGGIALAAKMNRAVLEALSESDDAWDWAAAQNNLGSALQIQGTWLGGTEGATLLGLAVEAFRAALRVWTEAAHPVEWAGTQNNLGNTLRTRGAHLGGTEGVAFLGAAAQAFRAALRVRTETAYPASWAETQNNLGSGLATQGQWLGGAEGAALLGEAVGAFRATLRVWTEAPHPVEWAMTQSNLGAALQIQGQRRGGAEGIALLREAVEAFHAALRVRTEATHPIDWAMTQNNLGNARQILGARLGGTAGGLLLGAAVEAFRAALRVWTEAAYPASWATTQNNLGNALATQGQRLGGAEGRALLGAAVEAYRAALRVRTQAAHPVDWAMTMENLGVAWEALAGIETAGDPADSMEEAAACFEAALQIHDPETMPYNHAKTSAALTRVQAKLAALPKPA